MRLFEQEHAATTDDWYTPPWIFQEMGAQFDVDVAAPPGGVPWIPADEHFDDGIDGLSQDWQGLVWCNPPYSAPTQWCYRWANHPDGIIVLRADLSTGGPAAAFAAAHAIFVPTPRLQFVNGHGDTTGLITFSTVLLGRGAGSSALKSIDISRGHVRELLPL